MLNENVRSWTPERRREAFLRYRAATKVDIHYGGRPGQWVLFRGDEHQMEGSFSRVFQATRKWSTHPSMIDFVLSPNTRLADKDNHPGLPVWAIERNGVPVVATRFASPEAAAEFWEKHGHQYEEQS